MHRAIEDALALSWTLRRKPLESFMLPAAAPGGDTLLCRDGSLVSLFRLDGARSTMGAEELERFVGLANRRLNNAFLDPGHALHVVFERAPDEAGLLVEAATDRQRRRGARLGLDLDDLFGERARRLTPLLAAETCAVACWTRPSALTAQQAKRDRKRLRERLRGWLPDAGDSQCPFAVQDGLPPRHAALLDALGALFEETGLAAERLEDAAALRLVRRLLNGPDSAAPDWRPVGSGNDAPPRATEPPEHGAFPPPLAPQLLIREPERRGAGLRVGNRLYGALDMILGPRAARPFPELMERLAGAGLPCRFSMLVEGGGLARMDAAVARVGAAFLAFSHPDSRAVRDAMRGLAETRADARAVVRLRLGLLTWTAPEDGEDALADRIGRLQRIAEGWGECAFSPLVGDPLEAFAASVPGFCCGGTAEPALAPLPEVLRLLPAGRPAPLAREADHLFRSPDGKMLPFSCAEGEDHGFELIYGVPGRGKSVLMNGLALAHLLQGGRERLPLAAIVDIGSSSSGLISLIREALPPDRRAEAGWFPLRMTAECAVNPCDTQLGCRRPLPAERAFLENLLGLILTPAGAEGVPDGMRELIGPTIARAYAMRSDEEAGGEPNAYTAGRDAEVDEALARAACRLPGAPLWWEIVDLLFDAGETGAAMRAQRYAVPVLNDLLAAVREPAVQGLIGNARHGAGAETVTDAFVRVLTALSGSWPVLFAPTAFEIGAARVAAIDLAEVAPRGSAEADRQTAAFYMLARHALTRRWWIAGESLSEVPERYRDWHAERLRETRETPKRLAYDEFHRTGGAPAVRAQVERDVREARKLRVRLCLASQRLEDFGPALVELANRTWVLGAGGKEAEALSRVFALSDTLNDAIAHRLTGPGKDGAPALLIASGRRGRFDQVVVNTPGPVELWALNTAPRDVALRERLYARLAPADARAALARRFPTGTAREWIDGALRRSEPRGASGTVSERTAIERLADDLARAAEADPPAPVDLPARQPDSAPDHGAGPVRPNLLAGPAEAAPAGETTPSPDAPADLPEPAEAAPADEAAPSPDAPADLPEPAEAAPADETAPPLDASADLPEPAATEVGGKADPPAAAMPRERPEAPRNPHRKEIRPMLNMNRATLLGNAGRDPETRETAAGDKVAKFTLATTERFRGQDGETAETTEWHRIVAFGEAAETAGKLVRKGVPVLVEGRLSTRSYEDREGVERRVTEIVVAGARGAINVLAARRNDPAAAEDGEEGEPADPAAETDE